MSKLNITELDFESIRQNLINFLSSQSQFEGFDFYGSNLSVLVDLLSYNTHYNAFYANMLSSEMFLDTAALRRSVVKKAAMLGYTPRSVTASKAVINVQITTENETSPTLTLDKYTRFSTSIDGVSYNFATINSHVLYQTSNNVYTANNVMIYQGDPITHVYTVNTASTDQRFILPNANTDMSTLEVKIKLNENSTNTYNYILAENITTIDATSNVYYRQEIEDGRYEVIFGDGILGRKIEDGYQVLLSALITEGSASNGSKSFQILDSVSGYSNALISTVTSSYGGSDRESIDSIKFQAPKNYQTQNRAVSVRDYKHIIETRYSDAESITVWGGEDNDPPVYGKVFICIKPKYGLNLTATAKTFIVNSILKERKIISITPEIVDPDYFYISINSKIKYDSTKIITSPNQIRSEIIQSIINYGTNNLGLFDLKFRYSKFTNYIDQQNIGILNNITTIKLIKKFLPTLNTKLSYSFNFNNSIYHPFDNYRYSISSTRFSHLDQNNKIKQDCFFDDLNGTIRIVSLVDGIEEIINSNIGSVNYETGSIVINQFSPVSIVGDQIQLSVVPATSDIVPVRNQVFLIDSQNVSVEMIDDTNIGTYQGSTSSDGLTGGGSAGTGG